MNIWIMVFNIGELLKMFSSLLILLYFLLLIYLLIKKIFFSFIFISWRLITLQYCGGFCHTLTWIGHGFTCVPHLNPPTHLPPHPITLGHILIFYIRNVSFLLLIELFSSVEFFHFNYFVSENKIIARIYVEYPSLVRTDRRFS